MAGKFYAVRTGRKTGVFTSWESCKEVVDGYSNADFKAFPTRQEAVKYIKGNQPSRARTATKKGYSRFGKANADGIDLELEAFDYRHNRRAVPEGESNRSQKKSDWRRKPVRNRRDF